MLYLWTDKSQPKNTVASCKQITFRLNQKVIWLTVEVIQTLPGADLGNLGNYTWSVSCVRQAREKWKWHKPGRGQGQQDLWEAIGPSDIYAPFVYLQT